MKRFFENTLISGAYSKALRVAALLCVLLGVSSSAWGKTTIPGSFNGWSTEAIIDSPYEVYLEGNSTYEFKIENGTVWWGLNGTMTRNDCSGWVINNRDGAAPNCKIQTDVAGTYKFTFDGWHDGNPKISVTYPPTEDQAGFFDNEALVLIIASKEYKYNKTHSATWNLGA